jgi:tetratricopeptide (TPR) repeat protein
MRTSYRMSAATPRSWLVALTAMCACVPAMWGASPRDLNNQGSVPFYGALDFTQESQAKPETPTPAETTSTAPTLAIPTTTSLADSINLSMSNLPPEMQGDLLMIRQRYLAAIAAYQRGPRDSAVLWNKLGIAYQHMYALDFAKMQYEKALSLNPNYPEAFNNLGTVYYGMKDYHKAENYYKKALRLKPDCASFYSNLGTAYFAEHKLKQGVLAYQQAFTLDPEVFIRDSLARIAEVAPLHEQASLNYALAKLYARAGNLEAAIRYLRLALMDGFDDRKKLMEDKEFSSLRTTAEFHLLMAEEHIPN